MYTFEEIKNTEFTKGRGYKEEEVNQFIEQIASDYKALSEENESLKLQLEELNAKCKAQEQSVYTTLESAKQLMADISASAEKRAEILLKNAQLDADNLIRQTKDSVENLRAEEAALKNRIYIIKIRLKNILETELGHVATLDQDLLMSDEKKEDDAKSEFDNLMKEL